MKTRTYAGIVTSVLSYGQFGGAIFSLRPYRRDGSQAASKTFVFVVVADAPLFQAAPQEGQALQVEGDWEDRGKFGEQFKASHIKHWLPRGEALVDFLGRYIPFGTLGQRSAKRLIDAYGDGLVALLHSGDAYALTRNTKLSLKRASWLCAAWAQYWNRALLDDVLPLTVSLKVRELLVNLYGADASKLATERPYKLAPFLEWNELNDLASTVGANRRADERNGDRLIAAQQELLSAAVRQGRYWMSEPYYVGRLALRLGSRDAARDAMALALKSAAINIVRGQLGNYVVSTGVLRIARALFALMLRRKGDSHAYYDRDRADLAADAGLQISLMHAPCLPLETAIRGLLSDMPQSTHILSTAGCAILQDIAPTVRLLKLPDLLHNDAAPVQGQMTQTFIVHQCDDMSLLVLNKLLHRLPPESKVMLVGNWVGQSQDCADGPRIFGPLWYSGVVPRQLHATRRTVRRSDNGIDFSLLGTEEFEGGSNCEICVRTVCSADLTSEALASYRECADHGRALLMTMTDREAIRFNSQLHNENAEFHRRGETPIVIRFAHNRTAVSQGDPVVLRRSRLAEGLVAGEIGLLRVRPADREDQTRSNSTNDNELELTIRGVRLDAERDFLEDASPGYAIPARVPLLSDADYVVVVINHAVDRRHMIPLVQRAVCHARRAVVVVTNMNSFDIDLNSPEFASPVAAETPLSVLFRGLSTVD